MASCSALIVCAQILSGCATYRDAALQGASDLGTIVGTAVGVPLGATAVALDESINATANALRRPRLYQQNTPSSLVQQSALPSSYSNWPRARTELIIITDPQYLPMRTVPPTQVTYASNSSRRAIPPVREATVAEVSFWQPKKEK